MVRGNIIQSQKVREFYSESRKIGTLKKSEEIAIEVIAFKNGRHFESLVKSVKFFCNEEGEN